MKLFMYAHIRVRTWCNKWQSRKYKLNEKARRLSNKVPVDSGASIPDGLSDEYTQVPLAYNFWR